MPATYEEQQALMGVLKCHPDFTIKLENYQWHVHSKVLSSESLFFQKLCDQDFKEKEERLVTLHDHCPWILARLIQWIYTGSVCIDHSKPRSKLPMNQLITYMEHMKDQSNYVALKEIDSTRKDYQIYLPLLRAADEYQVPKLMTECIIRLQNSLCARITEHREIFELVSQTGLSSNSEVCGKLLCTALRIQDSPKKLDKILKAVYERDSDLLQLFHDAMLVAAEELLARQSYLWQGVRRCTRKMQLIVDTRPTKTAIRNAIESMRQLNEMSKRAFEKAVLGE